jgi:hypothetical protein
MRSRKPAGCLAAPVAIIIYGGLGLLLLWQFGGQVWNYFTSADWQQVNGTVISSEVVDAWDTSGERYTPQVIYTYEIDATSYDGRQVNLQGDLYFGNELDAQQIIAPYPVGTTVRPYVDPSDPTRSVLERDLPTTVWWFVSIGLLLVLLSIGLGIRAFTQRASADPTSSPANRPLDYDNASSVAEASISDARSGD